MLLRSCLEFASYGFYIDSDKRLEKLWFDRHEGDGRAKSNFRMPKILDAIEARDSKLKRVFNDLYTRCIDLGAHPNERAIHGSLEVTEDSDKRTLHQIYLHGDGAAWRLASQSTAQVGLCALFVFQLIPTFTDRFMLLDLRDRLQMMRNRVDAMFRPKQRLRPGLILPSRYSRR